MSTKSRHEFGKYLRAQRVSAGISLRSAANKLGVSAVYLGEVERGVRPPLKKTHWDQLLKTIPSMSRETMERLAMDARPVQLDLRGASPRYQDLALSLSRRIESQNISAEDLDKLMAILGDVDE